MKSFSPGQSLLLMVLVGLAVAGWVYGIHWKRVAGGDGFTAGEKIIIQLQDQIRVLSDANAELNAKLQPYLNESSATAEDAAGDTPEAQPQFLPGVLEEVPSPEAGSSPP